MSAEERVACLHRMTGGRQFSAADVPANAHEELGYNSRASLLVAIRRQADNGTFLKVVGAGGSGRSDGNVFKWIWKPKGESKPSTPKMSADFDLLPGVEDDVTANNEAASPSRVGSAIDIDGQEFGPEEVRIVLKIDSHCATIEGRSLRLNTTTLLSAHPEAEKLIVKLAALNVVAKVGNGNGFAHSVWEVRSLPLSVLQDRLKSSRLSDINAAFAEATQQIPVLQQKLAEARSNRDRWRGRLLELDRQREALLAEQKNFDQDDTRIKAELARLYKLTQDLASESQSLL